MRCVREPFVAEESYNRSMRADELWFSRKPGPTALRLALTPLSWLYAAGWQAYLGLYLAGWKRAKEPHRPVICVGNLTVGGSGKTPVSLHVCDVLAAMGRQVVLSSSGYGSPAGDGAQMAPEGPLAAADWGDESAMLRWLRPEAKIVVGRNRVRAAEIVHREAPNAVMVLDDGFQHLPLKKHLTLILDDPNPENRRCLPTGPYREPRMNRARADELIPGRFEIEWNTPSFIDPFTGDPLPQRQISVQVLCALGRPSRFLKSLGHEGFQVEREWILPDHDPLTAGNLLAAVDRSIPLIVTAKDWVKLKDRPDIHLFRVWVALSEARIEPVEAFRELLHATLSQTP